MTKKREDEIWVFMDCRTERLFGFSADVLAMAADLAANHKMCSVALVVGDDTPVEGDCLPADPFVTVKDAVEKCFRMGADKVLQLQGGRLTIWRTEICAAAITEAVRLMEPRLVLFSRTDFGVETAAKAAGACDAGLISDCADITLRDNCFVAACPSWSGKIMAEISFSTLASTGFATVKRGRCLPRKDDCEVGKKRKNRVNSDLIGDAQECRGAMTRDRSVEILEISDVSGPVAARLLSRAMVPDTGETLETADIVVVGGAGLGSASGFEQVRELSAALGGVIGATRPPVLQKWVDEDRLIGQTGKTVNPKILFSVGTSGAVQYTAGIEEADLIIAINRDPHATIFEIADIGIVADAATLLPNLTARIRSDSLRKIADTVDFGNGKACGGFGEKIKLMRESGNRSQQELAELTGCTAEFVDNIETGNIEPSVSFLLRLSRAMGIDPDTFLSGSEKRNIRDRRAKAFFRRTQNYSYHTYTPEAEQGHLRAFMITIEPRQQHKPVEYKHEGEEFIFVLEGELELVLDGKVRSMKPGDTAHFNSEVSHRLKSRSAEMTKCLVILYTP